jgi:putative inorganic carbon (HCO3(-)) transporter
VDAFLRSPTGIVATLAVFAGITLTAFRAFHLMLVEPPGLPARSAGKRRRGASARTAGKMRTADRHLDGNALAASLATLCLLLPLVFTIALADVFALPKTWVLWAGAVVLLFLWWLRGLRSLGLGVFDLAVLTFAFLMALSTLAAPNPKHALVGEGLQYQGFFSIIAYCVLSLVARVSVHEFRQSRAVCVGIFIAATVAAAYALAQWLGVDPIWTELFKGRVFSTVGQANALASVLGMGALVSVALVPRTGPARWATLASVTIIALSLLLTYSRGGYLGLVLGLVVALMLAPRAPIGELRHHLTPVVAGSAVAATVILAMAVAWRPASDLAGGLVARAASIADPSESSNRDRLDLWTVGAAIALDHPLLGTGPDSYVLVFPQYRDRVLLPDRAAAMARFRPESPHNVYLAIADGSGIPALIAYLAIIAACGASLLRAARRPLPRSTRLAMAGLAGAIVVHLVTDMFMTGEPSSTAIFWILLGAAAGLSTQALALGSPADPAPHGGERL